MIGLSAQQTYYLYTGVVDMRKGFDGLSGLVRNDLGADPTDGRVYIFINRRRDKIKLLLWDITGYVLYYKRLERGRFEQILNGDKNGLSLSWSDLVMLLDGIELSSIKRRKRYSKKALENSEETV